jgi:hypothetical protein
MDAGTGSEKPRHNGLFKKGFDSRRDLSQVPPRRKPGTPNAITRDLKRGIMDAAERHGADGKGKDGVSGYCFHLAKNHPKQFTSLLAKILPMQINASGGNFIASVNIVSIPSESYLAPDDIARIKAQSAPATLEHDPDATDPDASTDTA